MIKENTKRILSELPEGVELIAAVKTRSANEILEAIDAGIKIIGHNYIQEAQDIYNLIGNRVKWHFIGHLQKNKVKKAVQLFDMIETIDSYATAIEINKICNSVDKIMSILIEINSGKEKQKFGVLPENAEELIKKISSLDNLKIMGLMTMGPYFGDTEEVRPHFIETKNIFEKIKLLDLKNVEMKYLSMGMTNSYPTAIEEGANIIRIGTLIFGERQYKP